MTPKERKKIFSPGLTNAPPLAMDVAGIARGFRHYYTHSLGRDKYCRSATLSLYCAGADGS